jgi:hypothetical protein
MTKKTLMTLIAVLIMQAVPVSGENIIPTSEKRKSLEITVYNQNIGYVKDSRDVFVPKGASNLKLLGISPGIQPETITVSADKGINILEKSYEYDLLNKKKLLDKYVGKKIKLVTYDKDNNPERTIEAELLSNNDGPVYKINDEIYMNHPGYHVIPQAGDGLYTSPTILLNIDNNAAKSKNIEAAYMTSNINWFADYNMIVDEKEKSAEFTGWATINNKSGMAYENAKLNLIAGDVKTKSALRPRLMMAAMDAREASHKEEGLFEYHAYKYDRQVNIENNQIKQLNLLQKAVININKELIAQSSPNHFYNRYDAKQNVPVKVKFQFKNTGGNNLGKPLPAGTVRMYKRDSTGSLQFIGEDTINHTPLNEEVKLEAGSSFDIKCEKVQKSFEKLYAKVYETSWEITVKNQKNEKAVINVIESLTGDWEITKSSHKYKKLNAFSVGYTIELDAGKEETIKYSLKVKR